MGTVEVPTVNFPTYINFNSARCFAQDVATAEATAFVAG